MSAPHIGSGREKTRLRSRAEGIWRRSSSLVFLTHDLKQPPDVRDQRAPAKPKLLPPFSVNNHPHAIPQPNPSSPSAGGPRLSHVREQDDTDSSESSTSNGPTEMLDPNIQGEGQKNGLAGGEGNVSEVQEVPGPGGPPSDLGGPPLAVTNGSNSGGLTQQQLSTVLHQVSTTNVSNVQMNININNELENRKKLMKESKIIVPAGLREGNARQSTMPHPISQGEMVDIEAHFLIVRLREVDSIHSCIDLVFWVVLQWKETPFMKLVRDQTNDFWRPDFSILNADNLEQREEEMTFNTESEYYRQTIIFKGTIANEGNLQFFPFDEDEICILAVLGVKLLSENQRLVHNPRRKPSESVPWYVKGQVLEWTIHEDMTTLDPISRSGGVGMIQGFGLIVPISRNSAYYVWKILLISNFIVVLHWTTFLIIGAQTQEEYSDRQNLTASLLLGAITFLFVVNDKLPRLPFLTVMDRLILAVFIDLFAGGVLSLCLKFKDLAISKGVNLTMGILIPVCYIAYQLYVVKVYVVDGSKYRELPRWLNVFKKMPSCRRSTKVISIEEEEALSLSQVKEDLGKSTKKLDGHSKQQ